MPLLAHADDPLLAAAMPVQISQLQTGSTASASEEFIELYNATAQPIDFAAGHWQLQIADAGATSWASPHRSIDLSGTLAAGAYYVLASKTTSAGQETPYLADTADAWFSAGIAAAGGHVRLLQTTNQTGADGSCAPQQAVIDELEWSEATTGTPLHSSLDGRSLFVAEAPGIAAGKSLQRLQDTDNDAVDFVLSDPTPKTHAAAPVTPQVAEVTADACTPVASPEPDSPAPGGNPEPALPAADIGLMAPQISELLPNPAAPATDADDEFVELYNPNDVLFDLSGFTLQTGSTAKHSYVFPDGTLLPAAGFAAFYSRDTELVLSNTAGQATLIDPLGVVVAQSDIYSKAAAGESWLLASGSWQWSSVPTPGDANQLVVPAVPAPPVSPAPAAKKSTAKTAAAPAVKAAKIASKAPKTAAKPKAAKPAKKTAVQQTASMPEEPPKGNMHIGVLAVVALIAVVYGAYEYRHELSNRFYQLRGNRDLGRKDRPGA